MIVQDACLGVLNWLVVGLQRERSLILSGNVHWS
jgi:hypothetical protein